MVAGRLSLGKADEGWIDEWTRFFGGVYSLGMERVERAIVLEARLRTANSLALPLPATDTARAQVPSSDAMLKS